MNLSVSLHDFQFDVAHKNPTNTVGVHSKFYFGQIDGIELGAACNSESECSAELVNMLTQTEPYTLECYLQEDIEYLQGKVNKGLLPDSSPEWKEASSVWLAEIHQKQALLDKVIAYKSALRV